MCNVNKKLLHLGAMAMMLALSSSSVFAVPKKVTALAREAVVKFSADATTALGKVAAFASLVNIVDGDNKWTTSATALFGDVKTLQASKAMANIVEATFAKIVFLKSIEAWVEHYLNGLTKDSNVTADTVEAAMGTFISKANLDGKGSITYEKTATGRSFKLAVTAVDAFSCTVAFDFKTGVEMAALNTFVTAVVAQVAKAATFIKEILVQVHTSAGNTALFYNFTPVAQLDDRTTVTLRQIIEDADIEILAFIEGFAVAVFDEATVAVKRVADTRANSGKAIVEGKGSAQATNGVRAKIASAVDAAAVDDVVRDFVAFMKTAK